MSSLGESAFCGTLTADTVNYKTLNPPIGGFVNNPLTGNLDCGGNDVVNCDALTASTINYTTLNPPLPTGGVFTPMVQNLDGGNFNILNVNQATATSGVFTTSSLGTAGCGDLTATGLIRGENITANQNLTASNNITAIGEIIANDRLTARAGLDIPSGAQNQIDNKTTFNNEVKFLGVNYGVPTPVQLGQVGQPTYQSFAAGANDYSIRILGEDASGGGATTQIVFDIETTHPDVTKNYVIDIQMTCADFKGLAPVPQLVQPIFIGPSQLDPGNTQKFSVYSTLLNNFTQTLQWTVRFYYFE